MKSSHNRITLVSSRRASVAVAVCLTLLVSAAMLVATAPAGHAVLAWQASPGFQYAANVGGGAAAGGDGRLYVTGRWFNLPEYCNGVQADTVNDFAVAAYDRVSRTWSLVQPRQHPRLNHGTARGGDGRVYVIGGEQPGIPACGIGGIFALNTVEAYTPATDTWADVTPMLTPRHDPAATEGVDGRIYVFGGTTGATPALASGEVYDTTTNSWSPIASMPDARTHAAAARDGQGRIYVIGGDSGTPGDPLAGTIERYTPTTNSWDLKVAPLNQIGLGDSATNEPDGRIFLFSGCSGYGISHIYDPATDTWTADEHIPMCVPGAARHRTARCTRSDR